jgi:hypothetical protein
MNIDNLRTVTGAVTNADATLGSAVPVDFTRYIYRIRFISTVGAQQLQVGKRENGAAGTTNIDTIQTAVPNEMITDPDELKEDAAPLYVIKGGPSRGASATSPPSTSLVRMATTVGAGIVTYWYEDVEG